MDGKMKSVASVPANYVSIVELQERWMKAKERNQKEKDSIVERGVKQQVSGQGRREDIMKVEEAMEPRMKLVGTIGKRNQNALNLRMEEIHVDVEEVVKSESKAYISRENHPVKQKVITETRNIIIGHVFLWSG